MINPPAVVAAIPSGSAKQVFWITILPRTGHGFRPVPCIQSELPAQLSLSYRRALYARIIWILQLNKG